MEKSKSLVSLMSFLWYAPRLCRTSILCFIILSFLRVHHGRGWMCGCGECWLGLALGSPLCLLNRESPSGITLWEAAMWWLDGSSILCLQIEQAIYKLTWRRKWQPTPVFLPGESQGQRSLVGCRLWGCTESGTTDATWQWQQPQHINSHADGMSEQARLIQAKHRLSTVELSMMFRCWIQLWFSLFEVKEYIIVPTYNGEHRTFHKLLLHFFFFFEILLVRLLFNIRKCL